MFRMFRRTFILVGTVASSLVILAGLMWFLSCSAPVARADSVEAAPVIIPDVARDAAYSGPCITKTDDITATTVWTLPCYLVMAKVRIASGVVLTISPPVTGTRIYFQQDTQLQVLGSLRALGTPTRRITFTSAISPPQRHDWRGIFIDKNSKGTRIQYSTIEYARVGIDIDDTDYVTITSNIFRHNGDGGVRDGAIGGDVDNSRIVSNTIYDCSNSIALHESHKNKVFSNTIYNITHYGIYFMEDTTNGGSENSISGNKVYSCGRDGIRLEYGHSNILSNNTVSRSVLLTGTHPRPAGAIYLSHQAWPSVTHNYVYSNGGGADYRAAIYITRTPSWNPSHKPPYVSQNVIHDTHEDTIEYDAESGTIAEPLMTNNALCSAHPPPTSTCELRNNYTALISATHNWWGTNTPMTGINYIGNVYTRPHIMLALAGPTSMLPDGLDTRVVTVTLRDSTGETVPEPAREIRLQTDWGGWGAISPAPVITYVTVNDNGVATATLISERRWGTATITATAFCNYSVIHWFPITPTNLAIAKTVAVTQVVAGEVLTYRIAYSNTSGITATNVYITDTLPSLTTWQSDTAPSLGWQRLMTTPQVVWFTPTLAPGASGGFVLTVTVAPTACGRLLTNTVTITTATAEDIYTDNVAHAGPVEVICADLVVFKDDDVGPTSPGELLHMLLGGSHHREFVYPGDLVTYTIDVYNKGKYTAFDVMLTETMPVTYADYVPLPSYMGVGVLTDWVTVTVNHVYTLDVGTLAPGEGRLSYFVIRVHPDLPYTVTNLDNLVCGATASPDTNLDDNCNHEDTPVRHPGLIITKTGDPLSKAGDVVTYPITVCNTGDVILSKVSVTDTLIPDVDKVFNNTLPPYTCEAYPFTRTVLITDPHPLLTNTVIATYQVQVYGYGPPKILTDTDVHTVELVSPCLTITKTGDPLSKAGDVVTYPITVCNCGDVTLTKQIVTDTLIPGVDAVFGNTLPPYTCEPHTFTRMVLITDPHPWLTNTVTATYQVEGLSNTLTVTDIHTVELVSPCLTITKTGDMRSKVGDDVTYTITVHNCGDVTLIKQDVSDILIDGVDDDFAPSLLPVPDGCETHTFTRTVQADDSDPLVNATSACYQVEGLGNILHDIDQHIVDLVHPGLTVTKTGDLLSKVGDVTTYFITVCNTGDVTLTKQIVTDSLIPPLIPDVDQAFGPSLLPGDCEPHTFTRTVLITDQHPLLTNTVTVTYQVDGLSNITTATDIHVVRVVSPSVTITKTSDITLSKAGHVVTYTVALTNTGDVTLTCDISDSLAGPIPLADLLPPGNGVSYTYPYTVQADYPDPLTNIVTATCQVDGLPNIITDTATYSVNLFQPSVDVQKTGPPTSRISNTITYTFRITNTSSADSPNLILDGITDTLLGGLSVPTNCLTLTFEASCYFTRPYTIPYGAPDPLTNTVTVTYHPLGFSNNITATDIHSVDAISPDIEIAKTPSSPTVYVSDTVTYTYTVTNPGDDPLRNIVVRDDRCAPIVYTGGDTNKNGELDLAEAWTYTCATALYTDTTNTATVTGTDSLNEPVTATATATVTITCAYGVTLTPPTDDESGNPGSTVTYTLRATNTGNCADIFTITTSGNAWTTTVPSRVGPLAAGEGADVVVTVTIPITAQCGDSDIAIVTATSQGDSNVSDSSVLTTTTITCTRPTIISLISDSPVDLGETMHFTAVVTGTMPITYAWDFGDPTSPVTGVTHVELITTSHVYTSGGNFTVTLTITNACGGPVTEPLTVTVCAYSVTLAPPTDAKSGNPDETVPYTLHLTNTGNCTDTFTITTSGNVWTTTVPSRVGPLAAGEGADVVVTVTIPVTAQCDDSDIAIVTATSQGNSNVSDSSVLTTTAKPVRGVELMPPTDTRKSNPGSTVTYTLRATNTGNCTDTFTVIVSDDVWSTQREPLTVTLPPDEGADVVVTVAIPVTAQRGDSDTVIVTVTTEPSRYQYIYLPLVLRDYTPASSSYGVKRAPSITTRSSRRGATMTYQLEGKRSGSYVLALPNASDHVSATSVLTTTAWCFPYLVAEIATGPEPREVALDIAGGRAFVAHDGGVTVIDTNNLTVTREVPLRDRPYGIAYDSDNKNIWVTLIDKNEVAVVNGETYDMKILGTGDMPCSVAYNPTNDCVYVTNWGDWTVNVYNAITPTEVITVLTGFAEPAHIAVNTETNKIYVTNHSLHGYSSHGQVTVIDGDTHKTHHINAHLFDAYGITVDITRNLVYVTSFGEGRISIIDGATDTFSGVFSDCLHIRPGERQQVPLRSIEVNPDVEPDGGSHLLLAAQDKDKGWNKFVVLRLAPRGWPPLEGPLDDCCYNPVALDINPYPKNGLAFNPQTNRVWVTSVESGTVSVIQDGYPPCPGWGEVDVDLCSDH